MGFQEFNRFIRPTQAVILAGGRGERLKPLTDTRPKPMIEFHGKPFLEYLIEMLRDQGFRKVLLLLGYLPEVIQDYFSSGSRWGMEITYSVSPPENETGRRIKLAEPSLEPCFFLMYCDNYWPMRLNEMWDRFTKTDAKALITIYGNNDHYTKDNVRIDQDGYVIAYDKSRTMSGLHGVEIGFAIINKSLVESFPQDDVSFEKVLYPDLAKKRQLLAYITDHRYYSVGSHERLPLTEAFLAREPAVILDRDGVLNRKPLRAQYVRTWSEFEWLPGAKEALRLFKRAGYRVIIVSNQAGISRGAMSETDLEEIHRHMKEEVFEAGGRIDAIYYCPHNWDDGCECRKPRPGMLYQAQRDFNLDLSRTYFIGDDERDGQAGDAAGCPWLLLSDKLSLLDVTEELLKKPSEKAAE